MKMREVVLIVLLPLQIAVCTLSQKEIPTGSLILLLFLLFCASLFFWWQIVLVKVREYAEKRAKSYLGRFNFLKLSPSGIKMTAKTNVTAAIISTRIFTAIALITITVLFLIYVTNNFSWIISHLIKASRVAGLAIFICGITLLIRNAALNKKIKQRSFSKENITMTGLIMQNMLFSMIAFVY